MSEIDRFLHNKLVIYDRVTTLRALARHFAEEAYVDFDQELFQRVERTINQEVEALILEVQRREERAPTTS